VSRAPAVAPPAVSVVLPTRGRPELLARAVRSILDQEYAGEIRCLVVFDGEDPATPDVEARPGRTIELLVNARSPGLAGARNTGIAAARTDLVAFCDDDDEWLPDKLRRQVDLLAASPGSNVAATGISIVRQGGAVERIPPRERVERADLLRSRVQEVHPSSILARTRALAEGPIGLIDEAIPGSYGEDYEWLLRAAAAGPIAVVRAPLVRVHWNRSSFFADRWATMVQAIHYLLETHPELRTDRRGLARLYGRLAFAHAALGHRRAAAAWARRTLRLDPRERRGYLALAVGAGIVPANVLVRLAHRFGRGI
jgi:glycosyltransferase involved in cell wall biosynthesis